MTPFHILVLFTLADFAFLIVGLVRHYEAPYIAIVAFGLGFVLSGCLYNYEDGRRS